MARRITAKDLNAFRRQVDAESARSREIAKLATEDIETEFTNGRRAVKELVDHYPEEAGLPAQDVPQLSAAIRRIVAAMLGAAVLISDEALDQSFQNAIAVTRQSAELIGIGGYSFTPSSDTLRLLQNYSADQIRSIEADLLPKVNGILARGALGNISPYKAMQEIDILLGRDGKGAMFQARRIVVTELNRIGNSVKYEQMNYFAQIMTEAGSKVEKTWVFGTDRPGRREQHRAIDGQTVPWDGEFSLPDGTKLRFPNDPNGPPHQTILCGCGYTYREVEQPEGA